MVRSTAVPLDSFASFGAFLKYLRKRAQLSQTELAIEVGYSTGQVSRLEHNQRLPDLTVLIALFVPALGLEDEPELVARMLELAAAARGESLAGRSVSFSHTEERAELIEEFSVDLPPDPAARRPGGLPAPATGLFGREADIGAVGACLLQPDVRLVTLIGPPGVGKTRLSLHVARRLEASFDEVLIISLAALTDAALLLPTIAQSLGVTAPGAQSLPDQLGAALHGRRLLLVLDNFEHILAAAPLVADLLAAAPGLKLLVTSRSVLRISGEHEYRVAPLDLPALGQLPPLEELGRLPAIQLFMARAQAVNPQVALTPASALPIAAICVRLEGLPLAIELAAARMKLLSPQALLTRLVHRFHLLTDGARDLPERQQTLQRAIDWSHDLLDPAEQALFARLAVFVDGWTEQAAQAVGDPGGPPILPGLASLLDKSLLQLDPGDDEPRFRMLETIRAYAHDRLAASGEAGLAAERHAAHFLALAAAAEPALTGAEQALWFARLEQDHGNLRAALRWATEQGAIEPGLRLATGIWRFWFVRGYLSEGRRTLEPLIAQAAGNPPGVGGVPADLLARALSAAGILAVEQGDYAQAERYSEHSLRLYRELGDMSGSSGALTLLGSVALRRGNYPAATAWFSQSLELRMELGDPYPIAAALNNLGIVAREQGNDVEATELYQRSLDIKRQLGNTRSIALALNNLGDVAYDQGAYAQAQALFQESLGLFEQLDEKWGIALLRTNLGNVIQAQGDHLAARQHYAQSLALYREMGTTPDISECLEGLAVGALAQREPERAASLYGAAAALREAIGSHLPPSRRAAVEQQIGLAQAELDPSAWARAWDRGHALGLGQAIEYALELADAAGR
jgi:predicted ATPase/transcriptional regulator with XRE-family HTH domain/Tfp pilus assembly protein PilF